MEQNIKRKYMKKTKLYIFFFIIFFINKNVFAFENNKKEIGGYFSTKVY